ncbi:GTPase Era [Elioraea sp.]|uniref:GTPase Era n=1 Tax=Elioraea sp. TaxID=2185103 RepID=UPI0021DC8127|nr:GTPase Era [Elioraea sp.]GIX11552.1 MAG: GTPase Era [Elioraea sp.]
MTATRAGFVAILGAPNAGKSTLLNRLVGAKLAAVSPKAQTTRFRIRGIVLRGASQIVLVDTPGIFAPRRMLDRAMVKAAWSGAADADIALLLVDAKAGLTDAVRLIVERLREAGRPLWLALNKVDLVAPPALLPLARDLNALAPFAETFMISAETGDGVERLLDRLAAAMPEGPFLYPEDELSDQPDRLLAAEIVREQIYRQTHEEVPYGTTVETESWEERADGSVTIRAAVVVAREGQKAIVIGKGGARLKAIGAAARAELERELDRRVHLFLHVLVRERWDEERARLRAMGLEPE